MKTYIIQLVGMRTMCSVMPETGPLYPLPHLVRHSPDGFAYGSVNTLVSLEMAISAQKDKPFWVVSYLSKLGASPTRLNGVTSVDMMEMQSSAASTVPTISATTPEILPELGSLDSVILLPALAFATSATMLPTLITYIGEDLATFAAITGSLKVNISAFVGFVNAKHLTTNASSLPKGTGLAKVGLAVFAIGDRDAALGAVERRIRTHGFPPMDHYNILLRHVPQGSGGPSDLARSIVGDLLNERDPKPSLYRPVVTEIISPLQGSGPFFVAEESVRKAIEGERQT